MLIERIGKCNSYEVVECRKFAKPLLVNSSDA